SRPRSARLQLRGDLCRDTRSAKRGTSGATTGGGGRSAPDPYSRHILTLMFALVASLNVKADLRDKFLAAAEDDSISSVRDEPGCLRFDVSQDNADPNHFYFYEVYRDEDAFQAHGQAPHFARWRAAAAEVLVEPANATRCTTVSPRDYK